MQVEFVTQAIIADNLLSSLRAQKLNLFYMRHDVEAGML